MAVAVWALRVAGNVQYSRPGLLAAGLIVEILQNSNYSMADPLHWNLDTVEIAKTSRLQALPPAVTR